jgi:hypothetical protein
MSEYLMRCEGYQQRRRDEWERARWQMFLAMQMHPYIKQHNKAKTPQEWIEFAWEKAEKKDKDVSQFLMTEEEKKSVMAQFEKMRKDNGQDR